MTNEAYTLMETNRDRAIVRRSARYKKGGSKSKKCTLGHEYKSKKELDKMNGECVSWKMTEFYSWEEFKQMPKDIQAEYLNYMIFKYGIGLATISAVVFKKSSNTLKNYVEKNGFKDKINLAGKKGDSGKRNAAAFKAIVWAAQHEPPFTQESENLVEDEPEEPFLTEEDLITGNGRSGKTADDISVRCSMSFSTEYIAKEVDLSEIVEIEKMFKGRKIRVSITIEAVDTQCY